MFLGYCGRIYVIDLFHLTVSFEFAKIRNLFYSAKYFLYRELNCSLVKKKGASLWDVPLGLYDSEWLWLLNHDFLRHGLFFFVGELGFTLLGGELHPFRCLVFRCLIVAAEVTRYGKQHAEENDNLTHSFLLVLDD